MLRPRLIAVLAVQAIVLGVVATGALGTSKDTPVAAPAAATVATDVAHDTSVKLADTPFVENDPNRHFPELEQQQSPGVAATVHDTVAQTMSPSLLAPATSASFDGLAYTAMTSGYIPPDPVGDVGLTQYVQAVNGGLAVFSKTGDNLTGTINDTAFWAGLTGCAPTSTRGLVDPTLNYDQFADRWVYSELSIDQSVEPWNQSYMCVAVSSTGDATDTWNRYVFAAGNSPRGNTMPDYPKLGVWPDGYYLSFNDFDSSQPHNYVGAGAMVLERSAMLNGAAAQSVFFDLRGISGLDGGMLPSDADGATPPANGTPNYFVSPVDDPADVNDQMGIWAFHVDWAVPSNSTFTNPQAVQVAAFNGQGYSVGQPGTLQTLSGIADDRLMNRVQYRNFGAYETLVGDLTVRNGSGGNAPRWFELRKAAGTWSVNQQSTFKPDSLNRWLGSVAMDGAGDMALGYSAGDASTSAGLRYTGRLVGDPLSTMEAEGTFVNGGGSQTSNTSRWGDYSQMNVDPTDDCTFWYTGEYYAGTSDHNWSTRIGSFRFPSCVTAVGPTYSVVPVVTGTLREGNTLSTTTGTWAPVPTSYAYQWRRCDSSAISCVDIPGATSSTYVLQAADAGRRLRVKVSATANTGTGTVVSSATSTILPNVPANSVLPGLVGTMQVAQTVSTDSGTWSTYASVVNNYAWQWQRCAPGCSDIPTATSQNYTVQAADAGAKLRVGVTVTTIGGSTGPVYSAQSSTVTLPPPPTNTVAPSVSGSAQELQWLTAQVGAWSGVQPITYTYQWQRCSSTGTGCAPITGETGQVYRLGNGDVDHRFKVTVTATNPGGAASVDTPLTARVVQLPPTIVTSPALSTGNPAVGSAVSTTDGSWSGLGPFTYTYQWQSCSSSCVNIAGATSNRLDVTSALAGTSLRAVVTATNAGGSTAANTNTSAVVPVPVSSGGGSGGSGGGSSGGSSGGGGGGGGSTPDLVVTGLASPASPLPGDNVTYLLTVTDKNVMPADRLVLTVTLPSGVQYVSSTADRGSGCVAAASTLTCNLDWLSGDATRANVQIVAKVTTAGAQTLSATAMPQQGDVNPADNTLTIAINQASSGTSGTTTSGTTTSGTGSSGTVPTGLNGDGTPTKKQDKKNPVATALASAGTRGSVAKLRFKIYDDHGIAKALTTVRHGAATVGVSNTGFGPVAYGSVYYTGWMVPARLAKGNYSFCVVAVDSAGNKSARSCAPLAVK